MDRLGVMGGTFDPPHIGHLIVARDIVEGLGLDRLLIMPAARPPHRGATFPDAARFELAKRAFEGAERIEVSDIEMRRPGPSYTVDTLAALRDRYAPRELFCVIGADQLRAITTWHDYERLPELARLVVMARGDDRRDESSDAPLAHERVEVTRVDLSSTMIRERLSLGRSIRYLVPETIRAEVEAGWQAHVAEPIGISGDYR